MNKIIQQAAEAYIGIDNMGLSNNDKIKFKKFVTFFLEHMKLHEDVYRLSEDYIKSDPDFEVEGMSEYQNGKQNGFIDGYTLGMVAENKEKWVILDDSHSNMPTEDGWYWVEMSIGSISATKEIRAVYYRAGDRRFMGEMDWNYAIRWMRLTQPKP